MRLQADIAVTGSGFAGALVALVGRRLGLRVVLLERGSHPRFAIGESSSPLANLLLEEIAGRYDLPRLLPLCKWGTWRRAYPEIGCGLKRGFSFFGHRLGETFAANAERQDQLLVAASPCDEIADTHWYRADFDHFLVREAQAAGADYLDHVQLDRMEICGDGKRGTRASRAILAGERRGEPIEIAAKLVVDASGPRGFVFRALGLAERRFPALPPTEALFSHFSGVARLDEMEIFAAGETPPYPVDDAAVHHVFGDGWIWVLRFANGNTSAGVAATVPFARAQRFEQGALAWERLLEHLPAVGAQFAEAHAVLPFVHTPRLSFRSERAAGPGWTLLPSAAAFVDPLLSTGFPLTLLGISRLSRALEEDWDTPRLAARLERDSELALSEADAAALLVGALYASFDDFPLFAALCMLYFAAASYAEAARRLGRPQLAGSFLLGDRADFHEGFRRCCARALELTGRPHRDAAARESLLQDIRRTIAPYDVAGLGRTDRRNWYPVDPADLLAAAPKLEATQGEIEVLLRRLGFPETAERGRWS